MHSFNGKFIKNKKYYSDTVYEWNLPAGWTCPFAVECKVKVDRTTGKFDINKAGQFRCYASNAERFPCVRKFRWDNYNFLKAGGIPTLTIDCKNVRVHASGDFYSQDYFDMWLNLARENPQVNFWAFTKSINYWINRLHEIPQNFILTASYGGRFDNLIDQHNLKYAKVFRSKDLVPEGMPIDTNDDYARIPNINFALLDNNKVSKKEKGVEEKTFLDLV
jgi:hypothetical protein